MVLETALENVVSKFSRHLEIIKPALEMLLQQVVEIMFILQYFSHYLPQVEANPETNGLRRLLAVKKSLAEFEQNVELVSKVIKFNLRESINLQDVVLLIEGIIRK